MKEYNEQSLERSREDLYELIRKMFILFSAKTRPENCWVRAWHVHDEWKELKDILNVTDDEITKASR